MKHISILILSLFAAVAICNGQTVTSSPLPIVLINVDGNATIPDDYKVCGTMKILYVDDTTTNYLSNQNTASYIHYEGRIGIEKRGSTSQNLNKRHYGFETRQNDDVTNANVALLGMPAENDWILNPLNYDNTYLRDPLSYALARRTGHYATRTHYCEVFVGGNYRGIYTLTEKIKADKNRVNIYKMDSTDNAVPRITGGYIIKADKTTGGDPIAWSTPAHSYWEDVNYIHHYPKPDDVTTAQTNYIHNYFSAFQSAMDSSDASLETGYPAYIDIPSFVDYMIVAELTSNVDIYQKSTFFYKDQQGKLCAGPVWDFNAAYGNDPFATPGRSGYNVWQFDNNDNTGSEFWYQLFHDAQFHRLFARRWHELTAPGAPLAYDSVAYLIDSLNNQISSLVARDKQRWGYYFNQTSAVSSLKTWLQNRYAWLNAQLTDTLNTLPPTPSLAITKIHYHPHRTNGIAADSLEFVGITNLTDSSISLAGVHFSELGFCYQFPPTATIAAGEEVYVAADTAAFRTVYRKQAYGVFTRSLSNSSQRIVLSDAWGRTIDDVTYDDDNPWPEEADGDGPFLTLIDPFADNSIGSNWSTDTTLIHPICTIPTELEMRSISYSSATIAWVADSGQTQWQIVVMSGDERDTIATTSNLTMLRGLSAASTFQISVRAICDEEHQSAWSDTLEFSTLECLTVSDINVTPSTTSAAIAWNDNQEDVQWEVVYGLEDFNPEEGITATTGTPTLTISGLEEGTAYDVYIRTLCDSSTYSQWGEKVTFVTERTPVGIGEAMAETAINIVPNPTSGMTAITFSGMNGQVVMEIVDNHGRTMTHKKLLCNDTHTVEVDATALPAGVYFVRVACNEHQTLRKLIVQ